MTARTGDSVSTMRARCLVGLLSGLLPLMGLCGCAAPGGPAERIPPRFAERMEPVTLSPRDLPPPATPPAGERIELREGDMPFLLFLPAGSDAGAHLVHPRHLAEVWRAVEGAQTVH